MWRQYVVLLAVTLPGLSASVSAATLSCVDLFSSLGRGYVASAPAVPMEGEYNPLDIDCPSEHYYQLQFDLETVRSAKPVVDVQSMTGVWLGDDVKDVFLGLYTASYEVLEIEPADAADTVLVAQRIVRMADPADFFNVEDNPEMSTDVVRAGLTPAYGFSKAQLVEAGRLSSRKVRYFDFPIAFDRGADLHRKASFLSMYSSPPITVKQSRDRLSFSYFDRAFKDNQRLLTFRRRSAASLKAAQQMLVLGEMSGLYFPCFVGALDAEDRTLISALEGIGVQQFMEALDEGERLSADIEALRGRQMPKESESRDEMIAKLLKLRTQITDLFEAGPLRPLITQAESDTPFGCVRAG